MVAVHDQLIRRDEIGAVLFDAYGTLLDVLAIEAALERRWPGKGAEIALLWRSKQIEYALLRSLGERYADFATVTRDALRFVADRLGLGADGSDIDRAMEAYMVLPPHPEVPEALARIATLGIPLAVLSNGTPAMLARALGDARLTPHFDAILSVEQAATFKTAPAAYRLGSDHFGLPPQRILFISSNGWDIAGAGWFGYRCFWINRAGLPIENLDFEPHHVGQSLADLADFLSAAGQSS